MLPRLVVVSRYLKSGSSKNLSNYVKYIATREGAATVKENNGYFEIMDNGNTVSVVIVLPARKE